MKLSELQLTKQCYMGDCAWFFRIDANYSGYTRDKLLYHVLDHAANKYTSYDETKGEFTAYLAGGNPKGYVFTPPGEQINNNGFTIGTINWVPVGIGAAVIAALLLLK